MNDLSRKPILKWPGGKSWLVSDLVDVIHEELDGIYFEPFLGGGALYLALAPENSILSDTNSELIHFYQTCVNDPQSVVNAAQRHRNSEVDYYQVRDSCPRSNVGKAGRFLYLNKTCWGGIFRLNQKGIFNVPYGAPGRTICRRKSVEAAAKVFAQASLLCQDFAISMSCAGKGDVIFADPPYTAKGQFNGFVRYNEHLFSWSDQIRLCQSAKSARHRGAFVAVCGSFHRDVLSLYNGWWVLPTSRKSRVASSIKARNLVHECVVFSRRPRIEISSLRRITSDFIESVPYIENHCG